MDMILNLLKQLATTLSPTEFLVVLTLIASISIVIVKFLIKHAQKKGGLVGALTGSANASEDAIIAALSGISKKIDELANAHTVAHDKIIEVIKEIYTENKEHAETFKAQITEILLLKRDLEAAFVNVNRQLDDMKHNLKMHEIHEQQVFDTLKELTQRAQDIMNRAASQLEKIDEFLRAAVPEFRSYHKELSKEVGELSRDIALIERSIQAQITTVDAVKLR